MAEASEFNAVAERAVKNDLPARAQEFLASARYSVSLKPAMSEAETASWNAAVSHWLTMNPRL